MPRMKNDGRGRNGGGRQKGSVNKDRPLKEILRGHSLDYFEPRLVVGDFKDNPKLAVELAKRYGDQPFSQYDIDLICLEPKDRVKVEVDILKFHTAPMQSVSAEVNDKRTNVFCERLTSLSHGEALDPPEDV